MTDKLDDAELRELTESNTSIAVAECIQELGCCSVFASGRELTAPWVNRKVEELVDIHVRDGAVISTQTRPQYFILKHDQEAESFELLQGPLSADDIRAERTKAKCAGR
jgi:hypothetical protein